MDQSNELNECPHRICIEDDEGLIYCTNCGFLIALERVDDNAGNQQFE